MAEANRRKTLSDKHELNAFQSLIEWNMGLWRYDSSTTLRKIPSEWEETSDILDNPLATSGLFGLSVSALEFEVKTGCFRQLDAILNDGALLLERSRWRKMISRWSATLLLNWMWASMDCLAAWYRANRASNDNIQSNWRDLSDDWHICLT